MRNSAWSGGIQALPKSRDISVNIHLLSACALPLYLRGILRYVGPLLLISRSLWITEIGIKRRTKGRQGLECTIPAQRGKNSVIELARNFPFPCQHFLKYLSRCIPTARESQAMYQACTWVSGELRKNDYQIILTDLSDAGASVSAWYLKQASPPHCWFVHFSGKLFLNKATEVAGILLE